jgi:uncharacterized caspase-like protein
MWRGVFIAAILLVLAGFQGAWAGTSRRVALVIANGDYLHAGSLKNPINDARIVGVALRAAGFQLVEANPNLGISEFRDALRRFRSNAAGAQVSLVYYAGHGVEARGKNWLIPVDAVLQQDQDLEYEAIDLDLMLGATQGAGIRVVILDACRDNPFAHAWRRGTRGVEQGLAPVDVDDVLVIYSAGPGQAASDGVGSDSPFAEALARRLPQPGLAIQLLGGMVRDDVLRATDAKQRPFISASITGVPFALIPLDGDRPEEAVVTPGGSTSVVDAKAIEFGFWQAAGSSNDVSQLRAYLSRFPYGEFTELANAKIEALERSPLGRRDSHAEELAAWGSVSRSDDVGQLNAYLAHYPGGLFADLARARVVVLTKPKTPFVLRPK